jgi:hypothetical protein
VVLDGFDLAEGLAAPVEAVGRGEAEPLARAALRVLARCGLVAVAVAVGGWWCSAGAIGGLNVATESIAPATRQTARMLASSGMIVPCPANGDVSRRSRLRRRLARSSRW